MTTVDDLFSHTINYVFSHWHQLKQGDTHAKQVLSKQIRRLHLKLSHADFQPQRISNQTTYQWASWLNNTNCRAGLLSLPATGYIPPHDHKNSIAVTLVLAGNPQLLRSNSLADKSPLSKSALQFKTQTLQTGDISFVFPEHDNIHGFVAGKQAAQLFSIVFQIQATPQRHYYTWSKQLKSLLMACMLTMPTLVSAKDCYQQFLHDLNQMHLKAEHVPTLQACASEGNTLSQVQLAMLYQHGKFVAKSHSDAFAWYLKAAKSGHVEAQYQVGVMLIDGIGVTEDAFEGIDWLFKASMAGHEIAKHIFDYIMENPQPLDC